MAIGIPGRRVRTEQPQEPTQVDGSNPLSRALAFVYTPTGGLSNPVNGDTLSVLNGPISQAVTKDGVALDLVKASTQGVSLGNGAAYDPNGGPFSACAIVTLNAVTTSANGVLLSRYVSGSTSFNLDTGGNYNGNQARFYINAGGNLIQGGSLNAGQRYCIVGTLDGSGNAALYIDGVSVATAGGWATQNATTAQTVIGRREYVTGEEPVGGQIPYAAMWLRSLSADEVASISANPWQLFAPRRILLPFTAANADNLLGQACL